VGQKFSEQLLPSLNLNPNAQSENHSQKKKKSHKPTGHLCIFPFCFFFFFPSSPTGHFCDPAKVVDEQLSMVTALDIAMTTHFMGGKKPTKEKEIQWN